MIGGICSRIYECGLNDCFAAMRKSYVLLVWKLGDCK